MSDPLLNPGMVIGETWEIVEPIGRGGMGEVWLAKHRRVEGKQAAIKILRRTTDGMPDQVARFQREAEIAARLEHPNIVQLFDFDSLPDGAPYLVMELLRGESLGKRLSRGPMPVAELQELVVAVGSALHVAHAAGVVHRDLKPENIFLVSTPTGITVKVLDFGISKLVDSNSLMTSEDIVLGTPQYMSPEQAMAEHQSITGQSDLFSLGTICFEALTGHRPFAAHTLARTVFLVAMEPSPSLRTYGPELPAQIIEAVDRALAKRPGDRTPDVATFVKEFSGVTLGRGAAPSAPPGPVDVATKAQVKPKSLNTETVSRSAPVPVPAPLPLPVPVSEPAPAAVPVRRWGPMSIVAMVGVVLVGLIMLVGLIGGLAARRDDQVDGRHRPEEGVAVVEEPGGEEPGGEDPFEREEPLATPVAPVVAAKVIDAGARHPKGQPTTPEQQAFLDNAHEAAARSDWTQVIEWTQKPAIAERVDAITMRVLAWCHLGNLSMVNAYKSHIAPGERGAVARACRAQGIDL